MGVLLLSILICIPGIIHGSDTVKKVELQLINSQVDVLHAALRACEKSGASIGKRQVEESVLGIDDQISIATNTLGILRKRVSTCHGMNSTIGVTLNTKCTCDTADNKELLKSLKDIEARTPYFDWNNRTVYHFTTFPTTRDYVKIGKTLPQMSEFTICIWTKTSQKQKVMHPFSYATHKHDNELLFIYTKQNVLHTSIGDKFVNGKSLSRNSNENDNYSDNRWHHVCLAWKSSTGLTSLYMDRVEVLRTTFKKGYIIEGGGMIILGQDQDSVGGRFSATQKYMGSLTGLNIWNKYLNVSVINCPSSGNVYSWGLGPEPEVHGDVTATKMVDPLCA